MRPPATPLALASLSVVLLAGCGTATGPATSTPAPGGRETTSAPSPRGHDTSAPEEPRPGGITRPPDLRMRGEDGWVDVSPYTWCWGDGCVDGVLPDPLPDLGTTDDPILLDVADGWQVLHSWTPAGSACGPQLVGTTTTGDGSPVELMPLGAAGDWQLDVMLRPPEGGDVIASAAVTTSVDHELPVPELRLTSFFDHDGSVVQYGPVELAGSYLPPDLLGTEPEGATAVLTVRSADGRTGTIDLRPAARPAEECHAPGTLLLREPGRGQAPSEHAVGDDLGEPPYRLTLDLELAGTSYSGSATWPDDVDEEDSTIRLVTAPALPRPEPADLLP